MPSDPTTEQKGWLTEMQNASGAQFDQIFVTRLRVAHGKIFPVIGAVRASTRDTTVRKLADEANKFVGRPHGHAGEHRPGPLAADAAGRDPGRAARLAGRRRPGRAAGPSVGVSSTVVWPVFLLALGAGGYATWRITRRS